MDRTSLVDIDTAPVTELQTVPGIGARTAQAIVVYRELHGSITPDAFARIPYIRLSSQMWAMIRFSKSDSLPVNEVNSENEGEEEELLDASGPVSEPVDKGVEAIERMKAVIANASLSGPPASYVNPPEAREDEQGARPKSSPPKVDAGWQQVSAEQPVQYRTVPVTPAAGAREAQPVQYQAVAHMPVHNGVQSGQYQAVTQIPVANGTYPVHYQAMAQGPQPVQYQLMTQVPVSQGGHLQYMSVGGQGQLIDPVNQPHMTYMIPPVQSGYVAAPQVVPTPQVGRSGATPRCVSRNATHAARGATNNALTTPVGQRAMLLGQQKPRLQSLPKALVFDGRGSWQAFLTKFEKYAGIFEWDDFEKRDFLCLCLTDKASEYYALVMDREVELGYIEVVDKLERRFGYRELPETARVTFSGARQGEEESVDDWADRVLTLAGKAFRDLPEEYMVQESILRFCMGAKEREAGEQVINQRPVSIEQAID